MSRRSDDNKDVLSKIHEQIVKDQNNDSTQTGSFPVVRRARAAFAFSEIRLGLRLTTGNDPVWVLSLF